jgi:hypothetical protein
MKSLGPAGSSSHFHVGSFVSFEFIADILDCNLQLVNRHLCDELSDNGRQFDAGEKSWHNQTFLLA